MRVKYVLVNTPAFDEEFIPHPALGPPILNSYLISRDIPITLIDLLIKVRYFNRLRKANINLNVFKERKNVLNYLFQNKRNDVSKETKKIANLGNLTKYKMVGFTIGSESNFIIALCLSKFLKEKGIKVIFGGPFLNVISPSKKELSEIPLVDYFVLGKGEVALFQIFNESNLNQRIIRGKNVHIENESIPSFNENFLRLYEKTTIGPRVLPYRLSEGCCSKCSFCTYHKKAKYEYKSIEKILFELKYLSKKYKTNYFRFCDSTINNDNEYLKKICEEIIKQKLKIKWGGFARPQIQPDILKLMSKAGCTFLSFGVESGSNKILYSMRKGFKIEEVSKTIMNCVKYKIKPVASFICGYPYETEEDFELTKKFVKEFGKYMWDAVPCPFLLLRNSSLYQNPSLFRIKIRKKRSLWNMIFSGPLYLGIRCHFEFDEIDGLCWEHKWKQINLRCAQLFKLIKKIKIRTFFKENVLLKGYKYLKSQYCFDTYPF